ncbi:hypothetical protein FGSG_03967 [Fusarium graminearum PH-1]|uniref:Chromosome 2, complete genome n=2 Tax=Gibberella zeae TaxID=5518 RepID=I1RJF1_GIBZE|nr:hypothetical protein FGSG_03967 [Fusarium graminearum PH-1]PCD27866.1 hypothetical protein FGRA07_03005 [Fusarium graminearum]ESU09196.1 hypothetical protein FGSG_03967 [Fusarium graminearum PH-1]CAF3566390.1 unnamed protein product [Fusarium graminearum]CAG1998156.1 unnamed protein product [Fusarium graminearum]CEF78875.1 unnamed protein product [Fusarium graminearum]|eukprot:XP_011321695.1 hypothetical protein FGSG_03967 [Fusarium graminearum PH-1]
MKLYIIPLWAIAVPVVSAYVAQHRLAPNTLVFNRKQQSSNPRCDLSPPVDPSRDGLVASHQVFSWEKSIATMIDRLQSVVRLPTVCYNDMGDFDEDERWEPFIKFADVLNNSYPNIHEYTAPDVVNKFGLVYTIQGSDKDLQPILLTAHQDVVPVDKETLDEWDYPPFSGYYDGRTGYLYGRGAADDKSAITGLMSAVEALLSQDDYNPRRTIILAFGFDHECSGNRGAAEIAKYLEKQYGQDGIAVILDEGGAGLQQIDNVLYALPAVYEKGYMDIWFNLTVPGGDSFAPPPHTAIGVMSEIVTTLEQSQFDPKVERDGPVHQGLTCFARYSPNAFPELTRSIIRGDLNGAARFLAKLSPETQYLVQTSQSADLVTGGKRIDALPEHVSLGVSHGLAPQDTVGSIEHGVVQLVQNIVNKYNLRFEPFEDDDDYDDYLTSEGLTRKARQQGSSSGTLNVEAMRKYFPAVPAPTSGRVWDIFAGTVRYTWGRESPYVVPAPGAMTGNTDSRHYENLCKNIYRWNPGTRKSIAHVHDTNERIPMGVQLNMAKFYYDFIRNFDQADI